jgi:signal transduction histidine kinase
VLDHVFLLSVAASEAAPCLRTLFRGRFTVLVAVRFLIAVCVELRERGVRRSGDTDRAEIRLETDAPRWRRSRYCEAQAASRCEATVAEIGWGDATLRVSAIRSDTVCGSGGGVLTLVARWLTGPVFGWRDVAIGDLALAVVVSVAGVVSAAGVGSNAGNPRAGLAASLAVLAMTVPVVFARRAPVLAAATLAAGAGLNWGAIGSLTRCGAGLPAVFFVAFAIGSRCRQRQAALLGAALLVVNLVCQGYSDPQLGGPGVLTLMVPIAAGFFAVGRLLRARTAMVGALRVRTAQLRAQREQNASLAVAAEQARVAEDLDAFLHEQIDRIAATAAVGIAELDTEPDRAQAAFVAIQDTGRHTLTRMRAVVAGLHTESARQPQPVLAQLDRLLADGTEADARLTVVGDPRLLPPGVELSGYRIVEHLLLALDDDPTARVDVVVTFTATALELTVAGPVGRHADVRGALAAAAERATLHAGTLRTQIRGGRRETVVHLSLVSARA